MDREASYLFPTYNRSGHGELVITAFISPWTPRRGRVSDLTQTSKQLQQKLTVDIWYKLIFQKPWANVYTRCIWENEQELCVNYLFRIWTELVWQINRKIIVK